MKHRMLRSGVVLMLAVATVGCVKEPETDTGAKLVPVSVNPVDVLSATAREDSILPLNSKVIGEPGNQALDLTMTVYKSASCGCCKDWVSYLEHDGFKITAIDTDNLDQIKAENGLNEPSLKSCHTALIDGYVIEGHVPASDIRRLLSERPDVVGLSAPGMPMMSPGMGSTEPRDYDVLAFQKDGRSRIFSSY